MVSATTPSPTIHLFLDITPYDVRDQCLVPTFPSNCKIALQPSDAPSTPHRSLLDGVIEYSGLTGLAPGGLAAHLMGGEIL